MVNVKLRFKLTDSDAPTTPSTQRRLAVRGRHRGGQAVLFKVDHGDRVDQAQRVGCCGMLSAAYMAWYARYNNFNYLALAARASKAPARRGEGILKSVAETMLLVRSECDAAVCKWRVRMYPKDWSTPRY